MEAFGDSHCHERAAPAGRQADPWRGQVFDLPSAIWDLPGLSGDARRNILGHNAARLFNLPDIKLQNRPNFGLNG